MAMLSMVAMSVITVAMLSMMGFGVLVVFSIFTMMMLFPTMLSLFFRSEVMPPVMFPVTFVVPVLNVPVIADLSYSMFM